MKKQEQYYDVQQRLNKFEGYRDFQQVIPNLFIGGQVSAINLEKLKENKIKKILKVNGIETLYNYKMWDIQSKIIDIDDMPDFDISPYVDEAHQFIHSALQSNVGVLVVCTAGVSRSATIVISYLIKYKNMDYNTAYQTVKDARIFIHPNVGFQRFLQEFATKTHCELCKLAPITQQFQQYECNKYKSASFRILLCDQCEGPMIVYTQGHKQVLDPKDYIELCQMVENFGNDFYGRHNWYLDNEQRTIYDHFHCHMREKKGVMAQLIQQNTETISLHQEEAKVEKVQDLKEESLRLVGKQLQSSKFGIFDKTIQVLKNYEEDKPFVIESNLRLLTKDGRACIYQTIKQGEVEVVRQIFVVKRGQVNEIMSKL